MAIKVPIRTVYDGSNNAIGLSEFQSGDAVGYLHGGTGLTALGSANQVLKINDAGTAIEWANEDALSATGTPTGTFGSASQVPVLTVGADGRISNISNTAVAGVQSVSYNTSNSLLTINTSDGGTQTTNITLDPFDTDNLSEGSTNQYFTTARARGSFSAGSGINIADGVISQATQIDYGLITGAVGANTIDYGSIV